MAPGRTLRRRLSVFIRQTYRQVVPRRFLSPHELWLRDKGDEVRRLEELGLQPGDVVLDFGAYRGEWAANVLMRYPGVEVHAFEPVLQFAERARQTLEPTLASVHVVAVGATSRSEMMVLDEDASRSIPAAAGNRDSSGLVEVNFVDVGYVAEILGNRRCGVAKVNIEGGEYELLTALADSGLLSRFGTILVQFQAIGPLSGEERRSVQRRLAETHSLTWEYPWVWERWDLRD